MCWYFILYPFGSSLLLAFFTALSLCFSSSITWRLSSVTGRSLKWFESFLLCNVPCRTWNTPVSMMPSFVFDKWYLLTFEGRGKCQQIFRQLLLWFNLGICVGEQLGVKYCLIAQHSHPKLEHNMLLWGVIGILALPCKTTFSKSELMQSWNGQVSTELTGFLWSRCLEERHWISVVNTSPVHCGTRRHP